MFKFFGCECVHNKIFEGMIWKNMFGVFLGFFNLDFGL
jgi:hypothetical protein